MLYIYTLKVGAKQKKTALIADRRERHQKKEKKKKKDPKPHTTKKLS